jgi:hypothetical protein
MTTCEGQHFIETLWETILSSSSRETPNRILPNLAHLLILCVFTSVLCGVNKEVKENNNKKPNPILASYIQTRESQTTHSFYPGVRSFFSYAALLFLKLFSAAQQNIFYKRK